MEKLIGDILRLGGRRERLEVNIFGGARIGPDTSDIGERNAEYAEAWLNAEGLVPVASELRGGLAPRLAYLPVSGRAFVVELSGYNDPVTTAEHGPTRSPGGAALFP